MKYSPIFLEIWYDPQDMKKERAEFPADVLYRRYQETGQLILKDATTAHEQLRKKRAFQLLEEIFNPKLKLDRCREQITQLIFLTCEISVYWEDLLSLLSSVSEKYLTDNKSRPKALAIFEELDTYLIQQKLVHKIFVTQHSSKGAAQTTNKTITWLNRGLMKDIPLPSTRYLLTQIYHQLEQSDVKEAQVIAWGSSEPSHGWSQTWMNDQHKFDDFKKAATFISPLITEVNNYRRNLEAGNLENEIYFQKPAEIYQHITKSDRPFSSYVPDIYLDKVGEYSLEEILAIGDEGEFCSALLKYLVATQKGSVLYSNISLMLFIQPEISKLQYHQDFVVNGDEKIYDLYNRILRFQHWMAKNFFLGDLKNGEKDTEFFRDFNALLERIDVPTSLSLAMCLYEAATESAYNALIYNTSNDQDEYVWPFWAKARAHLPQLAVSDLCTVSDYEIYKYLVQVFPEAKKKLTNGIGAATFETLLEMIFQQRVETAGAKEYVIHLMDTLGMTFIQRLNERYAEIAELIDYVALERSHLANEYWLNPNVKHTVEFSPHSFPHWLGLKEISFFTQENNPDEAYFYVRTNAMAGRLSACGLLDSHGRLRSMSFDLSKDFAVLQLILEHIVSVTFRDLLARNKVILEGRYNEEDQDISVEEDFEEDTESDIHKENRKKLKSKTIPRTVQQYEKNDPNPNKIHITSDKLVEIAETNRPVKIKFVDQYKRAVRYANSYLEFLNDYIEVLPTGDRTLIDNARAFVLEALEKYVGKVSEEKREKIPGGFQLQIAIDPATDEPFLNENGEAIYLETWVKSHTNPRMEEGRTLTETYQKIYQAGSSFKSLTKFFDMIIDTYELAPEEKKKDS